jgi:stress-induced-phosphoprotein 1
MEEEKNQAEEWKLKGNKAYKKKKFDEAIKCYDEALKLKPLEMIYYSNKVAVLTSKKDYVEANKVLDEALEKYPDSKRDFVKLGKLYGRKARLCEL